MELIYHIRQCLPNNAKVLQSLSLLNEYLQLIKPEIIDLAKMFTHRLTSSAGLHKVSWEKNADTLELRTDIFSNINAAREIRFADLAEMAFRVLTLPHSNADVQRIFNHMNVVKLKLRNRLSIKSLDVLLSNVDCEEMETAAMIIYYPRKF